MLAKNSVLDVLYCRDKMKCGDPMDAGARHRLIYRLAYHIIDWPIRMLFGYTCENDKLEEPALIVSNHVTDVDFFFVAIALHGSHIYYVASDHIFRLGWISRILNWLVAPISRRKGTTAMNTAVNMMRKLRAGYSVCVFGEGESTWNGQNIPVYPATATLAQVSGRPLKTFRIEGGHLSMPRWGRGIRRGKMHGHVINTYTPEQLKAMTPDEIQSAINRDIKEDAWERQKKQPVRYRSRRRAECIETVLFLCPKCKRIGTLYGKKHQVVCDCGFHVDLTEYGTFEPAEPFENIAQWDRWQMECLKSGDFAPETRLTDQQMTLYRLSDREKKEILAQGTMLLEREVLRFADHSFELSKISHLALIQKRVIVMTYEEQYYEIRADRPRCLRKYLAAWQNCRSKMERSA